MRPGDAEAFRLLASALIVVGLLVFAALALVIAILCRQDNLDSLASRVGRLEDHAGLAADPETPEDRPC